jgi:Flp pilus assembly protein TadB
MSRDVLKVTAIVIGIVAAGLVGWLIFSGVWARVGIGAAVVVLVGGLLLFAWNFDRKEKAKQDALDEEYSAR